MSTGRRPPTNGATVRLQTRVEWIDTDAAGIYHNSSVLRYVESAEAELMRQQGVDRYFGVAPRVRFKVDFEAPLFFGQQVTVDFRVARMGVTSLTFDFGVWGETFEAVPRRRAAVGSCVTVHVAGGHREGARAVPWPADWVARLGGAVS